MDVVAPNDAGGDMKKDVTPPLVPAGERMPPKRHPVLSTLGVLIVLVGVIVGGPWRIRDRLVDAATSDHKAVPAQQWQGVVTLRGTGTMDAAPFSISGETKGWRLKWTCQTGRLAVAAAASPGRMLDAACPGSGLQPATGFGPMNLRVVADGPWQLDVEREPR